MVRLPVYSRDTKDTVLGVCRKSVSAVTVATAAAPIRSRQLKLGLQKAKSGQDARHQFGRNLR